MARVHPSAESWRTILDKVALRAGYPESSKVRELGAAVRDLSLRYNEESKEAGVTMTAPDYAARLQFQFVRDVPKAFLATKELLAVRKGFAEKSAPLRVLDVGAGLGAMTWGVIEAVEEMHGAREWEVCMLDRDPAVLRLADEVRAAREHTGVRWTCESREGLPEGPWDIVVFGNVLSEIARAKGETDRLSVHADLIHRAKSLLGQGGVLLVIEPALRTRTRWLHRLRSHLVDTGALHVIAPCLHEATCPMLAREEDWCHEDRPVDLPPWLVPIAKEAGLRWEGLTFSFLLLAAEPRETNASRGVGLVAKESAELRVVSPVKKTKGKCELEVCGRERNTLPLCGVLRRLDRDRSPANRGFEKLERGDVFRMEIHDEMRAHNALRVLADTDVERVR